MCELIELDVQALDKIEEQLHCKIAEHFQPLIPDGFVLKVDKTNKAKTISLFKLYGREAFTISSDSVVSMKPMELEKENVLLGQILAVLGECIKHKDYLLKFDCRYNSLNKQP